MFSASTATCSFPLKFLAGSSRCASADQQDEGWAQHALPGPDWPEEKLGILHKAGPLRCPSAPYVAAGGRSMLWRHILILAKSSGFVVRRSCRCRKFAGNFRREARFEVGRVDTDTTLPSRVKNMHSCQELQALLHLPSSGQTLQQ